MSEKDKLIERLIDKLTEAPIDYGDRPERMDPGHERNLAQKQTTFSDHPAMPEVDPNRVESDYPEVMASKRFRDVIQDVVRFTGLQTVPTGQNGLQILARTLMTALERILDLEDNHREDLEKLAIDLVKQEFGITDDDFQWDVKILDIRHPEQKEEMEKKLGTYTSWTGQHRIPTTDKILTTKSIMTVLPKNITIVNAYTQYEPAPWKRPFDYNAFEKVFEQILNDFPTERIAMPRIGAGLAGGDWNKISEIINRLSGNREIKIYVID